MIKSLVFGLSFLIFLTSVNSKADQSVHLSCLDVYHNNAKFEIFINEESNSLSVEVKGLFWALEGPITDQMKTNDGSTYSVSGRLGQDITVMNTQLYTWTSGEETQWRNIEIIAANQKSLTIRRQNRDKSIFPKPWQDDGKTGIYPCQAD